MKQERTKQKIQSLSRYIIEKAECDSYRAGTRSKQWHIEADQKLLDAVGGRSVLLRQAGELEKRACISGKIIVKWKAVRTEIEKITVSSDAIPLLCQVEQIEDPRERQLSQMELTESWKSRVAQADWLIGMNGTRAYTTCYFKRLVVGRVQTPTLAMLAERQDKIEHFQKEAFYKVALTDGRLTVVSENIANEEAADLLASLCMDSEAVITQIKREQKKAFPPKLYDLTSLQREANRYFGYTAKKTLDMLQELYEEKLVTYPRTDSQFVTEDMGDTVEELVGKMPVLLPFLDYGQLGHNITRVINNAKVSDHHAILPTKEAVEKGISDLTADKKNLMMLVCQQLVQATGEEYQYEQTDIMVKCQGHDFTARGKVPVQMGFKAAGNAFKNQCVKAKPEEETEKETSIPYGYEEGMTLSPVKAEKTVHFTSPPKPFNEDTLLAAMETAGNKDFDSETEKKGLGTPATRAGIIEKLVSSGYAVSRR